MSEPATIHKTESEPYPMDALRELREEGYLAFERCQVVSRISDPVDYSARLRTPGDGTISVNSHVPPGYGGDWEPGKILEMITMPWAEPGGDQMLFRISVRELPKGKENDPKSEGIATTIREILCSQVKPIIKKSIFAK